MVAVRPPWMLFAAFCVAVVGEVALITAMQLRHPETALLPYAGSVDILLFTAFALFLRARALGGWRALHLQPAKLLRPVALALVAFGLVARALDLPQGRWLLPLVAAAEATVALLAIRAIASAWRHRGPTFWTQVEVRLRNVLPPLVVTIALGELRLLTAAIQATLGRPLPTHHANAFGFLRTSRSGFILPAALLLTLTELPALHALLHFAFHAGWAWHAGAIALNGYGLLWLLGDRRLLAEGAHQVTPEGLSLNLGARLTGLVPYEAIASVTVLPPGTRSPPGTLNVTPYDPPNLCIRLNREVSLAGFFGLRRRTKDLHLFVDDPSRLAVALVPYRVNPGGSSSHGS